MSKYDQAVDIQVLVQKVIATSDVFEASSEALESALATLVSCIWTRAVCERSLRLDVSRKHVFRTLISLETHTACS